MQVGLTRYEDRGERNMDEPREYDLFRFTEGNVTLVAECYVDEPAEVIFLRVERGDLNYPVHEADLRTGLGALAVQHLRESGKPTIKFSGGHEILA